MSATTDSTPDLPTKQCSKCGSTYPATPDFFRRAKRGKYGLHSYCKTCAQAHNNQWKLDHPDYHKNYRAEHKEHRTHYNIQWQKEHHEHVLNLRRAWRAKNQEHLHRKYKEWNANDPERTKLKYKRYRMRHPEKARVNEEMRRARILGAEGSHTPEDLRKLRKAQKNKCYYCGCQLTKYHVDHVIPLSRGGSNDPSNLVLACPSCNQRKGAKLPHEFTEGGKLL